jgi:hypothetical protein
MLEFCWLPGCSLFRAKVATQSWIQQIYVTIIFCIHVCEESCITHGLNSPFYCDFVDVVYTGFSTVRLVRRLGKSALCTEHLIIAKRLWRSKPLYLFEQIRHKGSLPNGRDKNIETAEAIMVKRSWMEQHVMYNIMYKLWFHDLPCTGYDKNIETAEAIIAKRSWMEQHVFYSILYKLWFHDLPCTCNDKNIETAEAIIVKRSRVHSAVCNI